jgi:hypothetical protein
LQTTRRSAAFIELSKDPRQGPKTVVSYRCEWCKREKRPGRSWILALAAERVTRTERRREIQVLRQWHSVWAKHPLAVHFCCADHLERYIDVLFTVDPKRQRARAATRRAGSGRPVVSLETHLAPGPAKRYEAAVERRTPSRSRAVQRGVAFTELDLIRAHGLGIVLSNRSEVPGV